MNEKLSYAVFKTTAGWVGILGSSNGLRRVTLPQPSEKQAFVQLEIDAASATLSEEYFKNLILQFKAYFYGQRAEFPDKLDFDGATDFQRAVWEATKRIPYGQNKSYAWVANKIGKPGAARAAGQALGKNPLPIIVPCHRVLSSDGALGGFSGGLAMKKRLLKLEKQSYK
ncbi:MAG: methylated-DNA--[protein]-cysteine S-methyltransferase [Dehalococcoidales bacterium]